MNRYRKILLVLAIPFYVIVFILLSSFQLLPSNIYSTSADRAISDSLRQGKTADDVTFTDIFKKNPYCLVDPTCVSFASNDGMALWQHEFRGAIDLNKFAVPNAMLFLLFWAAMLYGLLRLIKARQVTRYVAIGGGVMLMSLEVTRWFSEVAAYESNQVVLLASYLSVITMGLITAYFVVRATWVRNQNFTSM